jgi:hypothetical protein
MGRMVMAHYILEDSDTLEFAQPIIVAGSCKDAQDKTVLHRTAITGTATGLEWRGIYEAASSLRVRAQNNCIRKGVALPEKATIGLFLGMLGEKSSSATKAIAATLEAAGEAIKQADEMAKKIADLEAQLANKGKAK